MRLATIAAVLMIAAGPCAAAQLSVAQGDVLVGQGNGFAPGFQGQELATGDRVMIGNGGGQATITYADACTQQVNVGQLVVVQTQSPCAAGLLNNPPTTTGLPGLPQIPTDIAIIGGLGAAAVAAGVIVHSADSKRPVSP